MMRLVELWTEAAGYVGSVEILPFPDRNMPRVITWGNRTFVFDRRYPDADAPWLYVECFAMASITASPGLARWTPKAAPTPAPVDRSSRSVVGAVAEPGEPDTTTRADGQQRGYAVLSDAERAKGFVRPVRRSYIHAGCGAMTTMGRELAETYARDPGFYNGTFCVYCKAHFPVGASGGFTWAGSDEKVGT